MVAEEKEWIFASKFRSSFTSTHLKKYLEEKYPNNEFSCSLISKQDSSYNSFKIAIDKKLKN